MLNHLSFIVVAGIFCAGALPAQDTHSQIEERRSTGEVIRPEWTERASTRGSAVSRCVVVEGTGDAQTAYEQGNREYGRRDFAAAAQSYGRAARLSHSGAACQLASMYENGIGVQRDLNKAYQYYSKVLDDQQSDAKLARKRVRNELLASDYRPVTWI